MDANCSAAVRYLVVFQNRATSATDCGRMLLVVVAIANLGDEKATDGAKWLVFGNIMAREVYILMEYRPEICHARSWRQWG